MNSLLNPEAPEFYPLLTSISKDGYASVNKSIRLSNQLPSGQSFELFKTFTDFNIVSSQLSDNVLQQSNQIITTELPNVKLTKSDLEHNADKMVDCNDSFIDRVSINLDRLNGITPQQLQSVQISSWNEKPVIAKIQVGLATFIGAKNIPRPQLSFRDPIDNSDSLWVPKISDKPNNVKPLALSILYNDEGEAVGYEHPYQVELNLYQPAPEFLAASPAPVFPPPLELTKLTFVETEAQLDDLVAHLAGVTELAVDVEHHSYRTYQGITCLIQISTDAGGDFIIDALAAREHIHKLNVIFTDPRKLKVFHGAEMDVVWLQRDFGVYIVGLFDTYQAGRVLQISGLSLKHLLLRYCRVDADKKYQLADWRMRPLPEELIQYARLDTHYLLYIWKMMKAALLEAGAGQDHLLLSAFEQSRQICGTTYNKEVIREDSHVNLYMRSKKSFNSRQMAVLKMLYAWRDSHARELDESTTYLLPNHMMLSLAETLPRDVQGINGCCNPMPPFVKQNLITIHRMLLSCREMPLEPTLYHMPCSISEMVSVTQHPSLTYNVHDYSQYATHEEELHINLDHAAQFLEPSADEPPATQPDLIAFQIPPKKHLLVSGLNVDAKLFIPPYDRYRKYRALAQMEEIKEFKDKEAKIAALGKGNEIIQKEVLLKLRQAASIIELESNAKPIEESRVATTDVADADDTDNTQTKNRRRKRKISSNKSERKETNKIENTNEEQINNVSLSDKSNKNNFKAFLYKNVNYKKFYDESDKNHKVPKQKFKKRK